MSQQEWTHPDSERVEHVPGAVVLFTPCHGRQVFFPPEHAVPGAKLRAVCAADGVEWRVELIAHEAVKGGLCPLWAVPRETEEQDG
ncbi:MAG: hypothetical protein ACRD0K_21205 [Egibacteraceae bacterium]